MRYTGAGVQSLVFAFEPIERKEPGAPDGSVGRRQPYRPSGKSLGRTREGERPIGVVTDRDISCRGRAREKGPDAAVREMMSQPAVTTTPETDLDDCQRTLEENEIRRIPVVDETGKCCGMVSQADIARHASEDATASLVRDVSRSTEEASRVGCC